MHQHMPLWWPPCHHHSCTTWRKEDRECWEGLWPRSDHHRPGAWVLSLRSAVAKDLASPRPADLLRVVERAGSGTTGVASDLIRLALKSHSPKPADPAGGPPFSLPHDLCCFSHPCAESIPTPCFFHIRSSLLALLASHHSSLPPSVCTLSGTPQP